MSFMGEKLGIAADHAGKELKQLLIDLIRLKNYEVLDYGVSVETDTSVDYPDYAELLASELSSQKIDKGILICGTGMGMAMVANKFPGVRAAVVWDEFSTRMSRAHNDSNILCLGARTLNHHRACSLVNLWLDTEFEGDRHKLRLEKIRELEKKHLKPRS